MFRHLNISGCYSNYGRIRTSNSHPSRGTAASAASLQDTGVPVTSLVTCGLLLAPDRHARQEPCHRVVTKPLAADVSGQRRRGPAAGQRASCHHRVPYKECARVFWRTRGGSRDCGEPALLVLVNRQTTKSGLRFRWGCVMWDMKCDVT